MEEKAPSPQTTLLILLGASEWPQFPEFQASKAFANVVQRLKAYFLNPQPFGLPAENLLDLFDSEKNADELDVEISQFLERRLIDMKKAGNPARDVLLYFVGHGGFVGRDSDFYLAIRKTRTNNPLSSGLQLKALAHTLKESTRFMRRFIILDCCFAATAHGCFQGSQDEVAIKKINEEFHVVQKASGSSIPTRGTTLLCSSSHKVPSRLLPNDSSTMFAKAFLDVLIQGTDSPQDLLTVREVMDATANLLKEIEDAPQPEVHSPDQSEGDVADLPFFPNTHAQEERQRKKKEKEEQERKQKEEAEKKQEEESKKKSSKNYRQKILIGLILIFTIFGTFMLLHWSGSSGNTSPSSPGSTSFTGIYNSDPIIISNDNPMNLTRDSDQEIGQGLYFRVADDDLLRFYLFKQDTSPRPIEIRGAVASGTQPFIWTSDNFAGFFYDLNKNVGNESLSISGINGRSIPMNGLKYSTSITKVGYKYKDANWGTYPVIGFFGEKYVPLKENNASKVAKLILDSKDKYALKTGENLELGNGYNLTTKQVDVDGKKVRLELENDGQYVDDTIVSTDRGDHTWTCQLDKIQGEDNVTVLKVHVDQVFQGAVDSIAQIEGIWLIDYVNSIKINSDDEFGELNDVAISGPTITITNKDSFTLTRDSNQEIGQGLYFRVADDDLLRFYLFKQDTNPKPIEIRGAVASGTQPFIWTSDNFAGFFYDLNKNVGNESLSISGINGRSIPMNGLKYSTSITKVGYKYKDANWGTYLVIGFFGEKYVPLNENNANKVAKLILDSKDKYTLKTGENLELGSGYNLTAKQVDVDGKKVWLELDKDGQYVDDNIVSIDSGDPTWTCQLDNIQGENNVTVLKVHVHQVFQGAVDSIVQIEGIWLIDYANTSSLTSITKFK